MNAGINTESAYSKMFIGRVNDGIGLNFGDVVAHDP